jgi:hypothetical protein
MLSPCLFCYCSRVPQPVRFHSVFLFCRMLFTTHAGLTWDELCLVIEEQPWPDGSSTGRGGSQVRVIVCLNTDNDPLHFVRDQILV